jgi:hypothetical protein
MEKEFVTYELALRMKKLKSIDKGFRHGFNEKTFAYFVEGFPNKKLVIQSKPKLYSYEYNGGGPELISAPTYSQAFRWFREKQEIEGFVHKSIEGNYYFVIKRIGNNESNMYEFTKTAPKTFDTYEEAELACLEKLIEIVEKL